MNNNKTSVARREFVKNGAVAAATTVIGLSSLGAVKEALAQARVTGKPLLTESALNSLFSTDGANERSRMAAIAEARQDVKRFIRNRFTLTATQERRLDSMSPQQLESINRLLETAERTNGTVIIKLGNATTGEGSLLRKECPKIELHLGFAFHF